MKAYFNLILLVLLFSSSVFAQSEEKYSAHSPDLPHWVQLMYANNPDPGLVIPAYEAWYQSHEFIKNSHTQYYKRWVRQIARDVNGYATGKVDKVEAQRNQAAYLAHCKEVNAERTPASPWQCIGPFDWDHDAASRSYAPGAAHVYTVEKAPSNPNVLYAGTATTGVWKSIDNGANWSLVTRDLIIGGIRSVEIDLLDPNIAWFGASGDLYKTLDGGSTWNIIGDAAFLALGHDIRDIVTDPTNHNTIFVCSDEGLYRSTDAGANLTQLMGGIFQELEFHPTNPLIVYAIKQTANRTEFYKSMDGGLTWALKAGGWPGMVSASSTTFSGLGFDGTAGNYGTFASNLALGEGAFASFTIEMRIKTSGYAGDPAIFSNKNWNSGFNKGFVIAGRADGTWTFNIGDGVTRVDMFGGTITDNTWHSIAVSFDATGTKRIYQDGAEVNTSTFSLGTTTTSGLNMAIGQDGTLGYGFDWDGEVSEIRIWDKALSATEISDWRCQAVTAAHPDFANLTHYWKIDEGTGTTFSDGVGGNTGTITGTGTWNTGNLLTCAVTDMVSPDEQKRTEIAVTPASPNTIYALCTGAANSGSGLYGIYLSTDAGETWTFQCCGPSPAGVPSLTNQNLMAWSDVGTDNGGQYYYDLGLAVSPTDANELHVGGVNHWVSTDAGVTFTCPAKWSHPAKPEYVHADIHDIRYLDGELWIAGDGGIFYSTDGSTFTRRIYGIAGTDFWGFGAGFWDGEVMLGGTYHNGTLLKDNSVYLNDWICTQGGDNYRGFVNFGNERLVYHDGGGKTLPGDRTVGIGGFPFTRNPNATYTTGLSSNLEFDPRCYNHVYSGNGNGLWKSEDNGGSFTLLHDFGESVTSVEVSWSNPDVIYLSTNPGWWATKKLYKSTDAGASWADITPGVFSGSTYVPLDITISHDDENTLWIARTQLSGGYYHINGEKVYQSTDGGASWTNLTTATLDGEYLTNIEHQRGTDGGVYIGTRRAVYYRNNTMADWALFNNNLPVSTHSVQLVPYYREGKLRNGTNRSVHEVAFYEDAPPSAQISVDRMQSFCTRDSLYFVDHSALNETGATWAWSFPGGIPSTSTLRNPAIIYSAPGTYDVTLTVTDVNGTSTQTLADFITVSAECEPDTIPGNSLDLTASGDYATTPPLGIRTNEFTVSAWIKPDAILPDYTGIFINGGTSAGLNVRASNELAYHWPGGAWWWASGLFVPVNEWSHVALVVTPTSVTVYLNGIGSTHVTATDSVSFDGTGYIGSYQAWGSRNYTGEIDEVCIWDRSLTQEEIRELRHLTKKPSTDPNLIAYYQFNRASGLITDRSQVHHANLVGGAARSTSTGPFGGGSFHRMDVTTGGTKVFTGTGLTLEFPPFGILPNGEMVATRINLSPDQAPSAFPMSRSYWVVNNYGSNAAFTSLRSMTFENIGYVDPADVIDPSTFKLYKRGSNADGATWGASIDNGDAAVGGIDGEVSFNTGLSVTTFSQLVLTSEGSSILPVDWLGFTAHLNADETVGLQWRVIVHEPLSHFEVERSTDGVNFEALESIAADGSSGDLTFHTLDSDPAYGTNYYRIRQLDASGAQSLSEIREINLKTLPEAILVYPNPVESGTDLQVKINSTSIATVEIFEASGRLVLLQTFTEHASIATASLSSGVYFYEVSSAEIRKRGKLLLK